MAKVLSFLLPANLILTLAMLAGQVHAADRWPRVQPEQEGIDRKALAALFADLATAPPTKI